MPEQSRTGNEPSKLRQCGRCRQTFAGDPALHATALPEWWLCPPCHAALFGPETSLTVKRDRSLGVTPW
jgi:hypothetical protein